MATTSKLYLPVATYVAVAYVLYSMKPQSMFDSAGTPRPFGLKPGSRSNPTTLVAFSSWYSIVRASFTCRCTVPAHRLQLINQTGKSPVPPLLRPLTL